MTRFFFEGKIDIWRSITMQRIGPNSEFWCWMDTPPSRVSAWQISGICHPCFVLSDPALLPTTSRPPKPAITPPRLPRRPPNQGGSGRSSGRSSERKHSLVEEKHPLSLCLIFTFSHLYLNLHKARRLILAWWPKHPRHWIKKSRPWCHFSAYHEPWYITTDRPWWSLPSRQHWTQEKSNFVGS